MRRTLTAQLATFAHEFFECDRCYANVPRSGLGRPSGPAGNGDFAEKAYTVLGEKSQSVVHGAQLLSPPPLGPE